MKYLYIYKGYTHTHTHTHTHIYIKDLYISFIYIKDSLVAQLIKNPPAMQETLV